MFQVKNVNWTKEFMPFSDSVMQIVILVLLRSTLKQLKCFTMLKWNTKSRKGWRYSSVFKLTWPSFCICFFILFGKYVSEPPFTWPSHKVMPQWSNRWSRIPYRGKKVGENWLKKSFSQVTNILPQLNFNPILFKPTQTFPTSFKTRRATFLNFLQNSS